MNKAANMFRKALTLIALLFTCVCHAATVSAIFPEGVTLDAADSGMQYDKEKSVNTFKECFTGQASLTGVMQAYWLPVWNDETEKNDKYLQFRFAPDANNLSSLPKLYEDGKLITPVVIDLGPAAETDEGMGAIAFFTNETVFEQIRKDFQTIPDNFFRYREGHIEQTGTVLIDRYLSDKACDRRAFFAQLLAFAPQKSTFAPATLAKRFDAEAGCGGRPPYEETFSVMAPDNAGIALKAGPDEESETLRMLDANEQIVKVDTVNDLWLKVSLFSQPDVQGYLLKSQLSINN